MYRISKAPLLVFSVALLTAAEPFWKTKPIAQWSEEDAKQLLTASPWVKVVTAGVARPMSEDELRAGGEMGEHHGVGYDGVEGNKPSNAKLPSATDMLFTGKNYARLAVPRVQHDRTGSLGERSPRPHRGAEES